MGEEKMNDVTKQEQSVEEGKNSQLAQAGGDVTQNQKNYFFVGDDERAVGAFSLDRAIGLKKSELLDAKRYFVYPEGQLKIITDFLEDKHFIFLTGEECRGKFYTAKYLSCLLTEANNSLEVLLVESISSNNYVNLLDLVNEEGAIKNTVIIFKDVLKKANPQLKDFFCSLTKERFKDLSQKLINRNAYFIFTADDSTLTDIPIENIEANKRVKKLDSTIIMIGINKRLPDFFTSNKSISKEHVNAFLKELWRKFLNKPNISKHGSWKHWGEMMRTLRPGPLLCVSQFSMNAAMLTFVNYIDRSHRCLSVNFIPSNPCRDSPFQNRKVRY